MLNAAIGLTEVDTEDLKHLLGLTHRGEVSFPLGVSELARTGLQHCAPALLGQLRGLDDHGVRAVLVAVIAERIPDHRLRRLGAVPDGEA